MPKCYGRRYEPKASSAKFHFNTVKTKNTFNLTKIKYYILFSLQDDVVFCTSKYEYSKDEVVFLHPNTTLLIQTLNQGIIAYYARRCFKKIMESIGKNSS